MRILINMLFYNSLQKRRFHKTVVCRKKKIPPGIFQLRLLAPHFAEAYTPHWKLAMQSVLSEVFAKDILCTVAVDENHERFDTSNENGRNRA